MEKKYRYLFFIICLTVFLFGCQEQTPETVCIPNETTEAGFTLGTEETATLETVETLEPTPVPADPPATEVVTPPAQTEEVPDETQHQHKFTLVSQRDATCSQKGEKLFRCSCSAEQVEVLPQLSHTPDKEADCITPSSCTRCGTVIAEPIGHQMQGNTCARCDLAVTSPVFVLGKELSFDESAASVEQKLGSPTERITEGDLVSLVYAHDITRLTVVQTDGNGLWGVFTMDPASFLTLGGKTISIASFAGAKDPNSEAYYQDTGSCRIFGFRDTLQGGDYYGLWMRYSECSYDYMDDSRLYSGYYGQNRLSYYYTNALRAKHGLSVLTWSDSASAVATEYSAYMIENDFFHHDGSYADRLSQKGVYWTSAGENISQGYFNAFFVCDAYYNSTDHRTNILSTDFTHVGMGYCRRLTAVTVFGAQIFYGQ